MLSNLTHEHAPAILSHILTGRPRGSSIWSHWRGRYGLTEVQQEAIWKYVDPERVPSLDSPPTQREEEKENARTRAKVTLRFQTYEGEVREVEAEIGENLLDVGKKYELPSLEGVCDGNLGSCNRLP